MVGYSAPWKARQLVILMVEMMDSCTVVEMGWAMVDKMEKK